MKKLDSKQRIGEAVGLRVAPALLGSWSLPKNKSQHPVFIRRGSDGIFLPHELLVRATRAGLLLMQTLATIPRGKDIAVNEIQGISDSLWDQVGVRFLLLDMFFYPRFSSLFQDVKHPNYRGPSIRNLLDGCARLLSSLMQPDRFMVECSVYGDQLHPLLVILFKDGDGHSAYNIEFAEGAPSAHGCVFSQSQLGAIEYIRRSIRVQRRAFFIKGLHPRNHLFLVGMSGVGKSFCVHEASKLEALPCFSTSLPSWVVLGARGTPTLYPLQHWLVQNPQGGVIHIDEIDKITLDKNDGNSSWFSAVRNEIIRLLDRDVSGFPGFDSSFVYDTLGHCLFVASGSFQDLFRSQISRDAFIDFSSVDSDSSSIIKEVNEFEAIDTEDIRLGKYLPEELINRFSRNVVHLRCPTIAEYSGYLSEVDANFQIYRSDQAILDQATSLFASGAGFRGLEDYVQECLQNQE